MLSTFALPCFHRGKSGQHGWLVRIQAENHFIIPLSDILPEGGARITPVLPPKLTIQPQKIVLYGQMHLFGRLANHVRGFHAGCIKLIGISSAHHHIRMR